MEYAKGDRIVAVSYGATDAAFIGQEGTVTGHENGYVKAIMDNRVDNLETFFLPSEIKKVEPVATAAVHEDIDVTPVTYDPDLYGIRLREFEHDWSTGDSFEFFHKPSGKVLLTTQFVSLSTLLFIAGDHAEGNR